MILLILFASCFASDDMSRLRAEKHDAFKNQQRKAYVIIPAADGHYISSKDRDRIKDYIDFLGASDPTNQLAKFPPDVLDMIHRMHKLEKRNNISPAEELLLLKFLQRLPSGGIQPLSPDTEIKLGYELKAAIPILTEDDIAKIQEYAAMLESARVSWEIEVLFREVAAGNTLTDHEEMKLRKYIEDETFVELSHYSNLGDNSVAKVFEVPKEKLEEQDGLFEQMCKRDFDFLSILREILGGEDTEIGDDRWKQRKGKAGKIQTIHSNNVDRDIYQHEQAARSTAKERNDGGAGGGGARAEFHGGEIFSHKLDDNAMFKPANVVGRGMMEKLFRPNPVKLKFAHTRGDAKRVDRLYKSDNEIQKKLEDTMNKINLMNPGLMQNIMHYVATELKSVREYSLQRLLLPLGMASVDVPADGDCFYHAIQNLLEKDFDIDNLRRIAYEVLTTDESLKAFLPTEGAERDYEDVLKRGEWAGHEEIKALTIALDCRIRIYQIIRRESNQKGLEYHEFGDETNEDVKNILFTSATDPSMEDPQSIRNHFRPMFETQAARQNKKF